MAILPQHVEAEVIGQIMVDALEARVAYSVLVLGGGGGTRVQVIALPWQVTEVHFDENEKPLFAFLQGYYG